MPTSPAADLDGDGIRCPLRVLGNKIAWYENDGSGNFRRPAVITTAADWAQSVFAADVDGDGDLDVLSASSDDDKIAWYENLDGIQAPYGPVSHGHHHSARMGHMLESLQRSPGRGRGSRCPLRAL